MAPKPIMVFLLELNSTPLPKASGEKEKQSDKTQSTLKKLQIKIKTMDSKGMLPEVSHLTSINRNYTDMERPITELLLVLMSTALPKANGKPERPLERLDSQPKRETITIKTTTSQPPSGEKVFTLNNQVESPKSPPSHGHKVPPLDQLTPASTQSRSRIHPSPTADGHVGGPPCTA